MSQDMSTHLINEVKAFHKELKKEYPEASFNLKENALSEFEKLGLPDKKEEIWKYTNASSFLNSNLKLGAPKKAITPQMIEGYLINKDSNRIVFINGNMESNYTFLNENISLSIKKESDLPNGFSKDSFGLLNKAISPEEIFIEIKPNFVLEEPLEILHLTTLENDSFINCPRVHIKVGSYSKISTLEHFFCEAYEKTPHYFVNAQTSIICEEGSSVEHVKCQRDSLKAVHIAEVKAIVKKDSAFKSFTLSLGANLARNNISSLLEDTWAHTNIHGLFVIKEDQHCDNYSVIDHKVANTTSDQLFKGVLDEKSHGVFTGKVIVNPDAQQVNSGQLNKNLLLSKSAKVNTRPILEIEADDVKCAHGATIGQIDENQAFYLRTRGVSERKAQEILCQAFVQEALDQISHIGIRKFVSPLVENYFNQFKILDEKTQGANDGN
ncbi:MAG: Fe-S cluster assembly protein SufD [Bdellovibrionota bacterium]|nr:Fe-S cluster assembly protein SufD [Bdellovibrionota bacterium]